MSLILDGTNGLSDVDGTAATPAIRGTDTNTGIFFPAVDTAAVATGGVERVRIDSAGNLGIGTSSPSQRLAVNGNTEFGATIFTGLGVSTADTAIELGGSRSANGNCYIDLHSTASTDFESRILRIAGANGAFQIINTGTGDFRLQASGAAPMIFDTSATERMRITAAGQLRTTVTGTTMMDDYGCRAWVNFNGTGTVAIRASGNVSSITDNGTGNYTVNFTTAMPDANYAYSTGSNVNTNGGGDVMSLVNAPSASSIQVLGKKFDGGGDFDSSYCFIAIFR